MLLGYQKIREAAEWRTTLALAVDVYRIGLTNLTSLTEMRLL